MAKPKAETIADVFVRVTEDLAFMVPERETTGAPCRGQAVSATMRFSGPVIGDITLAASEAMCREVAANILGVDLNEDFNIQKAFDAFGELLNVTSGNLLTGLFGDAPVFNLTVPETSPTSVEDWAALAADPNTLFFNVDEYPVLLRFRTNS